MRVLCQVFPPFPPQHPFSYGESFKYAKIGVFCWVVNGFSTSVEWINQTKWISSEAPPGANKYKVKFFDGWFGVSKPEITIHGTIPSLFVDDKEVNLATGKGVPYKLPR